MGEVSLNQRQLIRDEGTSLNSGPPSHKEPLYEHGR